MTNNCAPSVSNLVVIKNSLQNWMDLMMNFVGYPHVSVDNTNNYLDYYRNVFADSIGKLDFNKMYENSIMVLPVG